MPSPGSGAHLSFTVFFPFFFLARCQLQCLGAPIFSGFGDNTITFSHFLCQIRTGRVKDYIDYKNSPNTRHLVTTEVFKLLEFCLKEGKTHVFSSTDPFQELKPQGLRYVAFIQNVLMRFSCLQRLKQMNQIISLNLKV